MQLIPIKEQDGFLYLFIGTNREEPDDPAVHCTYAKDESEAETIFLDHLGSEADSLDEEAEEVGGEAIVYQVKL